MDVLWGLPISGISGTNRHHWRWNEEMTANIKRMQQALGLEKLTSDEVRDYLRKMSSLVFGDGGKWRQCMSVHVTTQFWLPGLGGEWNFETWVQKSMGFPRSYDSFWFMMFVSVFFVAIHQGFARSFFLCQSKCGNCFVRINSGCGQGNWNFDVLFLSL